MIANIVNMSLKPKPLSDDAKAQLIVLSAGIASAETATLVNKDQIDGARARMIQQQSDIQRYKNLIKEEATTGSDLELVQSAMTYP